MKRTVVYDTIVNVLIPLLLGVVCYYAASSNGVATIIKNHLADGLWAYAFLSCIFIIWHRKISLTWVLVAIAVAIGYEWLQYRHTIQGTGDVYDVLTYLIFFIITLKTNRYFKRTFGYQN